MGRLLLVRHGESLWNRDAIVQGQAGPGLSPLGRRQAEATARWIAEEVRSRHGDALDDVGFVSSDLPRCRETAAPIAALLGREPVLDEAVRERHFGSWQGVARADLATRDPDVWARFTRREDVIGEVGGESTGQLVERVVPAFRRHAAAARTVVVVTHGGPVWHGVHALLGIPESVLGHVANASVATLDVTLAGPVDGAVDGPLDGAADDAGQREYGVRLVGWNAVGHMPPALRATWQRPAHTATIDDADDADDVDEIEPASPRARSA